MKTRTSDEHFAFIKQIREKYTEASHLIYADWLEERGDPISILRSELIRKQVAGEAIDSLLISANVHRWIPPTVKIRGGLFLADAPWIREMSSITTVIFTMGIPTKVKCPFNTWLKYGKSLVPYMSIVEVQQNDLRTVGDPPVWHKGIAGIRRAVYSLLTGGVERLNYREYKDQELAYQDLNQALTKWSLL